MSREEIKVGDKVKICWVGNEFGVDVIVDYVPCSSGDLWHLRKDNGDIIYLNQNASSFECLIKIKGVAQ